MSKPVDNSARSQIQQDWANREYVEVITTSIKRITDFLNSFGTLVSQLLIFKSLLWQIDHLCMSIENRKCNTIVFNSILFPSQCIM